MYCLCEEYTLIGIEKTCLVVFIILLILFRLFVDLHNQFESITAQNCAKKLSFSNIGMYTNQI